MRDYDPKIIEQKWQERWRETRAFDVTEDPDREKFYCLVMFAYPSRSGPRRARAELHDR